MICRNRISPRYGYRVTANLRTDAVATLVFLMNVCCAAGQPATITGITSLTPADVLLCHTDTLTAAVICVWPAPLLLPELSKACVLAPVASLGLGISGSAGGGWTDLSGIVHSCWNVTSSFCVGALGKIGWKGASGFSGSFEAMANIQAKVALLDHVVAGVGVDALVFTNQWNNMPPRALRFGIGYVRGERYAIDVDVNSDYTTVLLSTALELADGTSARFTVRTYPLSIGTLVRFDVGTMIPISAGIELITSVGMITTFVVEL